MRPPGIFARALSTEAPGLGSMAAVIHALESINHVPLPLVTPKISPVTAKWSQITRRLLGVITHEFGSDVLRWRLAYNVRRWQREVFDPTKNTRRPVVFHPLDHYLLTLIAGPYLQWAQQRGLDPCQSVTKLFLDDPVAAITEIDLDVRRLWRDEDYYRTPKRTPLYLLLPQYSGALPAKGVHHLLNVRWYRLALGTEPPLVLDWTFKQSHVIKELVALAATKVVVDEPTLARAEAVAAQVMDNLEREGQLAYALVAERILLKHMETAEPIESTPASQIHRISHKQYWEANWGQHQLLQKRAQTPFYTFGDGKLHHHRDKIPKFTKKTIDYSAINYDLAISKFLPGADPEFLVKFKALAALKLGFHTILLPDSGLHKIMASIKFDVDPQYNCVGFSHEDNVIISLACNMFDRFFARWFIKSPQDAETWLMNVLLAYDAEPQLISDTAIQQAIAHFRELVIEPPSLETWFSANRQWTDTSTELTPWAEKVLTLLDD